MRIVRKKLTILTSVLVFLFTFSIVGEFLSSSFAADVKMARRRKSRFSQETKKDTNAIQQQDSRSIPKTEWGIFVISITPDSAASYADLRPGDVITDISISSKPMADVDLAEFVALMKNAKEGETVLTVTRNGRKKRIIVHLPPLGISPRLGAQISEFRPERENAINVRNPDLKDATRRVDYQPSNSLSQRLEEINVLKYALIDEETKRVVFIGTYDPTYASGPISYRDLLADALTDPYPSFSLDYKQAMPSVQKIMKIMDAEIQLISRNTAYGMKWMNKTMMSVLNSKDPIPEKLLIEERMRNTMGIEPEEWMAYVNLDIKSNATTYRQYELIENFLGKLFTSLGIEERFGRAFIVLAQAQREYKETPNYQTTLKLCNLLHINEELQQVRSDYNTKLINDETAARRIFSLYYRTLLKGFGVSPSKVDAMADRYRDGYTLDEDLAYALEDRYQFLTKEALRLHVFQSFVLSQDFLHTMYPNLPIAYSGVRLYGRQADSPLTRVMFDADYAFKYITSLSPETVSVPGHKFSVEFFTTEGERLGISLPDEGMVRYWIKPGVVKMNSFKDKSGVYFISVQPEIGADPLFPNSDLGDYKEILDSYAEGLTQRYDAYAKLYPSLHIMREAEKIIAFARWIKNSNIEISIDKFNPSQNPVPAKVKGFVTVSFVRKEKGDMDSLFLGINGGVVFDQEEGEEWIQEEPSVEVTDSVLNQLAASTALAEQAAGAALDGDLDAARDLSEKSAQAMTGSINLTQLPRIVAAPEPIPSQQPDTTSIGTRAVISQEAISAVGRNLQATAIARKQIVDAEPLRETSPEQYQAAVSSARNLEQRSKENLQYLQGRLSHYRANPVYPQKLIVDLQNLDPTKPAVVQPLRTEQPVLSQKEPAIEAAILKKEKLLYELSALESELAMTRTTLMRLNRDVQLNNMLFKEWQNEAAGAIDRAENRAQGLIQDTCSDGFFSLLKWKSSKIPAKIKKIDQFEKIIALKDLPDWAKIDSDSWEEIGKAFVSAVQSSPLSAELQTVIKSTQSIIDSSYDITAWFASWHNIQQLDKNSDAYLIAVRKISKHMERIVTRMNDVKTQLQNNAS